MTPIICGVDVSSISLEAFVNPAGPGRSFANSAEGIAQLACFCQQHGVQLVALEATGGYEKQAFALLWAQGVAVALLNPRAVRDFAKAMGWLEKTDRIDARMIARFAAVKGSVASTPASAEQQHLKALVTRLRQLTQLHVDQRNQRLLVTDATVRASISKLLKVVEAQKRSLAAKITAVLASDPLWKETGGGLPQHQRRGGSNRGGGHGGYAGDRLAVEQSRVQAERTGSAGPGQRKNARAASGARRTPAAPRGAVCGGGRGESS